VGTGSQLTQRLQGTAAAVQTLVGALGGESRTAGLVASMAGSVAQFSAMGSMLGPAGTVIGAVVGFGASIVGLVQSEREAAAAAEELANRVQRVERSALTAGERIAEMNAALARTVELSGINLGLATDRSYAEEITRVEAELDPLIERVEALHAGGVTGARASTMGAAGELLVETNSQIQSLRDRITELDALRSSANAEAADLMAEDLAAAAGGAAGAGGARGARGVTGGGGEQGNALSARRDISPDELIAPIQQVDAVQAHAAETARDLALATDAAARLITESADAYDRAAADIDVLNEKTRERFELEREIFDQQREFGDSYVASIDEVTRAWNEANEAASGASVDMMSSGRLLERSLVAVGNSIAETVGGTMLNAFEKAMGAWLDGTKTFVEAAEEMVAGVLKALVIESVVQAITETARGISDMASYQYATGAAHFAAAGAWAAVGVAAGAVGAGIGAFGGGGGSNAQPAPTSRELAGDGGDSRGGDTYEINVFPGGFITQDQVSGGIVDGLNRAARNGRRVDSRVLGR